jgi:hypothetical protein
VTKVRKVNLEIKAMAMGNILTLIQRIRLTHILTLETVAAMDQAIEICRLQTLIHQLSSCCLPRNVTVQYAHKEPCWYALALKPAGKLSRYFLLIRLNLELEISEDAKITTAN